MEQIENKVKKCFQNSSWIDLKTLGYGMDTDKAWNWQKWKKYRNDFELGTFEKRKLLFFVVVNVSVRIRCKCAKQKIMPRKNLSHKNVWKKLIN